MNLRINSAVDALLRELVGAGMVAPAIDAAASVNAMTPVGRIT